MGKKAPMNIKKTAGLNPSPNHNIAIGIHAIGGIGRKISKIGSARLSATFDQPIEMPKGIAIAAAIKNPTATLRRLVTMCEASSPETNKSTKELRTEVGQGRRCLGKIPNNPTICQTATAKRTERIRRWRYVTPLIHLYRT